MSHTTKSYKRGAGVANDTDSYTYMALTISPVIYKKIPGEFLSGYRNDTKYSDLRKEEQQCVITLAITYAINAIDRNIVLTENYFERTAKGHCHSHGTILIRPSQVQQLDEAITAKLGYKPKPNATTRTVLIEPICNTSLWGNYIKKEQKEEPSRCPSPTSCHMPVSIFLKAGNQ